MLNNLFRIHVVSIRKRDCLTKLEKGWTFPSLAIENPVDQTQNFGEGMSFKSMYTCYS